MIKPNQAHCQKDSGTYILQGTGYHLHQELLYIELGIYNRDSRVDSKKYIQEYTATLAVTLGSHAGSRKRRIYKDTYLYIQFSSLSLIIYYYLYLPFRLLVTLLLNYNLITLINRLILRYRSIRRSTQHRSSISQKDLVYSKAYLGGYRGKQEGKNKLIK